jgi:hypothetical protein
MNLDQLKYNIKTDKGVQLELERLHGAPIGTAYYVDSANGKSHYDGRSWSYPLATINQAVAKCSANSGDVIYVAPWHAETIAAAASNPTVGKAGVKVMGVKQGNQLPTITYTHADATTNITAANSYITGVKFVSNVADVKVGLTLAAAADNSVVYDCLFRDSAADKETLVFISVASGNVGSKIINNDIYTTAAAGGNNAINLVSGNTNTVIANNTIYGKFATGGILGSAACLGIIIEGNRIVNAEAAIAIALHANSTGILAKNYLGGNTSIAAALAGETKMWCFENYVTGDDGASGVLDPAVDSDGE